MFPTSKSTRTGSVSEDVARVVKIISKSGLPYKVGAMSTCIEGDWDRVMFIINRARQVLRHKNKRLYINITVDDRKGARGRITGKIDSIEKRLGREISK
jgi:uncharacterized protein (TIGR00106 family)